ncbi:MAG: alpha/beta hydrolase family protein [Promethearchaeota archaeon]|jgi:pimeloyl-ACP methyl ester carboxylesterase
MVSIKEKVYKKLQSFFTEEVHAEELKKLQKIIVLILVLTASLIALEINRASSYKSYNRVLFGSAGVTLYANLYAPAASLPFQDNHPLIIYCHGIGSKRDFDLRVPIEFTKRGFYVAALDYQGHGESGGSINNIDQSTNSPALARDCSNLLEKLKTLPFYSDVNSSQIGLIGHSLGGMVVLMNQALDPDFKVTVAWAPLVNFTPPQFGLWWQGYEQYIPINLINSTNSENLLIIMHKNDEVLDFKKNAVRAQELTNCTLVNITMPLLGGGHQLLSDEVLFESINWFEQHFFNSELINGPIKLTFFGSYVLIIINFGLLLFIVFLLIAYSARFFRLKEPPEIEISEKRFKFLSEHEKIDKTIKIVKIAFYSAIFVLNWQLFATSFGIIGIFYASIVFCVCFLGIKLAKFLITRKKKRAEPFKTELIRILKEEFSLKIIAYTAVCAWYFILVYLLFSYYYPFAFFWPSSIGYAFLSITFLPIYLATELLFRKIIYPLLNFLKSESSKVRVTIISAFIIYMILMALTRVYSYLPSVLFTFLILLLISIFNTIIYGRTKLFSAVMFSSFDIIQLFFSAAISNIVGIGATSFFF